MLEEILQKLHDFSEYMAKIDALYTKSLTFLNLILNFPPPPELGLPEKYTPMLIHFILFVFQGTVQR